MTRKRRKRREIHTFDIYDTAIERTTFSPRGIFTLIEQKVGNNFKQKRVEAEFKVRLKQKYHTLEDVYKLLPEFDINVELQTELENSYPKQEVLNKYNSLPEDCRYFISDMYLTAEQLKPILEHCGYENPKIFSSIDYKASKSDGNLYDIVQKKIGKIYMHYGDNYKSDIVNAKKHGVKHVVFNTALHKYNLWTPKLENNPILSRKLAKKELELGNYNFFEFMYHLLLNSIWYYEANLNEQTQSAFIWICQRMSEVYQTKGNCVPFLKDFDMTEEDYINLVEKFVHEPIDVARCFCICNMSKLKVESGKLFKLFDKCEWKEGFISALKYLGREYEYLAKYFTKPTHETILSNRNTDTLLRHICQGQQPTCFAGDIELIRKIFEKYPNLKEFVTVINEGTIEEYKDMLNNNCVCYTVSSDQDEVKQWLLDCGILEEKIKRIYK